MESARVLAERGHQVTLCEKSGELGGNLIPGSKPHFKRYDRSLIDWYQTQLKKLGVKVLLNTAVSAETVASYQADEVIIATGSTPVELKFEGTKKPAAASEVLLGQVKPGKKVVIIGGGLVGCETGLWLAQQGADVTVLEILPEILGGHGAMPHMNQFMLEDLLKFHKVQIMTKTKVTCVNEGSVSYENEDGAGQIPADTVISAVGYKENNGLYESLKDSDLIIRNIGDSQKVHNIMYSIWNAYELARNL